jgi:hypothetical protein
MKLRLMILTFLCVLSANQNTNVSGNIEYYFMSKLSDSEITNIPFRLLNLKVYHQRDNLDVNGEFAIEYRPRLDTDFTFDSNPTDFNPVLRELFITYYLDNGEFSFGKKKYTWGSADENSPIDNLSPYDYYYLLNGSQERKLGIYSASFDFYFNNEWKNIFPLIFVNLFPPLAFLIDGDFKISGMISPLHNTSRFPVDDPDYPLGLPVSPSKGQFIPINNPYEVAFYIQKSLQNFDFSFSHFRGYDRVFNVTGFALYKYGNIGINPQTELKYSYRLTEANNLGFVALFNDFTVRSDITLFRSFDRNDINSFLDAPYSIDVQAGTDNYNIITAADEECGKTNDNGVITYIDCIYPFKEDAKYIQGTFQVELPLPNDYLINLQYFKYDVKEYRNLLTEYDLPDNVQLPNVQIDLESADNEDLFLPGLGAPYSILSKKLTFIIIEKYFPDNDLKLSFTTVYDLDEGSGHLFAFETEYNFGNGLETVIGFNKINGDSSQDDLYTFNAMEDFSSFRTQLTYNF